MNRNGQHVARVRIRMYQVGFGDCFRDLPGVRRAAATTVGAERHMLIDFGSTRSAREGRAKGRMSDVAKLIAEHTHGKLDVLVLTHRHKDHLFGFSDDTGGHDDPRPHPELVLRPWTEHPDLSATADSPAVAPGLPSPSALPRPGSRANLSAAQDAVDHLAARPGLHADLKAAAKEQLKNADAIALLDELSANGHGRYLFAGADRDDGHGVPGLDDHRARAATVDRIPGSRRSARTTRSTGCLPCAPPFTTPPQTRPTGGSGAEPTVRSGPVRCAG